MIWMLWVVIFSENFHQMPSARHEENPPAPVDAPDENPVRSPGRAEPSNPDENPMPDPCRTLHLRSRYCRPFRLPAASFADLERFARRRLGQIRRNGARQERLARASFWLPEITLEWGRLDVQENAANWQAGQDFDSRSNQEYRNFWKIRATWSLRGLARDPQELERARHMQIQMEYLQKQVDRIRKTYYQWFHEVIEYRRNPSLRRLLQCEELEAELNDLTSGAFSVILGGGT